MVTNTKILGVTLNQSKSILYSMQGIYGIGKSTSRNILKKVGINPETKVKDMNDEDFSKIRAEVESGEYVVEGDLRQKIYRDIARLKSIKAYRGIRHKVGLPVHGQNTKKNARTRKGKVKMAVGGLNKTVSKK
jgi:small subunit ribosomal protein S13